MRRGLIASSVGIGAVVLALLGVASPAQATGDFSVYASPTGGASDPCTLAVPCSLDTAKSTAAADAALDTGNVTVYLAGGTYQRSSTLAFTTADSASTHSVSYQAQTSAPVVISGAGGPAITGWTQVGSTPLWQASVDASQVKARQIYVNGVRANVDSGDAGYVFGALTKTSTGYSYVNANSKLATKPDSWTNTGTVDFGYLPAGGNAYQESFCPGESVGSGAIVMQSTGDDLTKNCFAVAYWLGGPTMVENNKALLGTPGQFYIDPTTNTIYYTPRVGESMGTASVIAPTVQTLVSVTGTSSAPVKNISFSGISFEYASFGFTTAGALDAQSNSLVYDSSNDQAYLPGGVRCVSCNGVNFTSDSFLHFGGAGLDYSGGGSGNTVKGNVFSDISSNGVQVGQLGSNPAPIHSENNYVISDNEISNVGNEFQGGVGIAVGLTSGTAISHNDVWNTGYSGISLGNPNVAGAVGANNSITNNYVHDVMTSAVKDGGPIYVTGAQSSTGTQTISGNYVSQSSQAYADLYLDTYASNWTVTNNVVGGHGYWWAYAQTAANSGQTSNDAFTNNFVGNQVGGFTGQTAGNTVGPNSTGLTSWPAGANAVIANAGLEPQYAAMAPAANTTDLAWGATATSSTSYPGPYGPSSAIDEDGQSLFSTNTGDTAPYWQVDLGASYPLSTFQILGRYDTSQPEALTNINVLVSNSPSLTTGTTTACTTSASPLPFRSTWDCAMPAGNWRYVSIVKTDTSILAFAEARVFGSPSTIVDDRSSAITYTGAWTQQSNAGMYSGTQTYTSTNGDSASYTFTGTGIDYITGEDTGHGTVNVSIDGGTAVSYDCTSATTKYFQVCASITGLAPGSHTIVITKTGGSYLTVDAFRTTPTPTPAPVVVDDRSSAITYTGAWTQQANAGMYDGTQSYTTTNGDSASYTFTGTGVDYITAEDSSRGTVGVSIDGGTAVSYNCASSITIYYQVCASITGLAPGSHTIVITKTGGSYFTVDAFRSYPSLWTIFDDRSSAITYTPSADWIQQSNAAMYDGTQTYTATNGDSATFAFTGTGVEYMTAEDASRGTVDVSIDGGTAVSHNCSSAGTVYFQACASITGLSAGSHTIKVTKTGGTYLTVDAFRVHN